MKDPFDLPGWHALLEHASRAPSAHNTQPARWRAGPAGELTLFEDTRRRLPVGDPSGRDHAISLGMAYEGMSLALSERRYRLAEPAFASGAHGARAADALRPVASTSLLPGAAPDPLAEFVPVRRTFRGHFERGDGAARARLFDLLAQFPDVVTLSTGRDMDEIARLLDHYSYEFLRRPDYYRELHQWMRFRPSSASWSRDGLNADCMALGPIERVGAMALMYPPVFDLLKALRLAPLLIAESSKVRSADAVAVLTAPDKQSWFDTGRRFYRLWLEIARAGFALCPMSVLADSEESKALLRARWGIAADREIINVLRIGRTTRSIPRSARLPVTELLV